MQARPTEPRNSPPSSTHGKKQEGEEAKPKEAEVNWKALGNHAVVMSNVAKRAKLYNPIMAASIQCEQHFPKELVLECLPVEKEREKIKKRRCDGLMRERMLCITRILHPQELIVARDSRDNETMDSLAKETYAETQRIPAHPLSKEEISIIQECSKYADNKRDHLLLIKSQDQMECLMPRLFPKEYRDLRECLKARKDVDYCTAEATEAIDLWAQFYSKAGPAGLTSSLSAPRDK